MFAEITSLADLTLFVAYIAGFISFFASCVLPLVPIYLAYLAGVALQPEKINREKQDKNLLPTEETLPKNPGARRRWLLIKTSLLFALGFSIAFMALGWSISTLSTTLNDWRWLLNLIFGGIFVLFGLHLTGLLTIKSFNKQWHFTLGRRIEKHRSIATMLTGLAFGLSWTPCIGPILALILYQASHTSSQLQGILLLASFSAGLATPFIITGILFEAIVPWLKKTAKISQYVELVSGIILILVGLFILTGQMSSVTRTIDRFFDFHAITQ